ncbi:MAG: hypothetical protein H8D56_05435 [Planctomycetes bacterium]|nr:hypothetical protein [Planctomycetota bacterium]MBL7143188.1 hypothetical protein [Phycisphaerae bacterium]
MKNINSKKAIFYLYGIIALSLITANVPAFGGNKTEDPKSYEEKSLIIEKNLKALRRAVAVNKERRAFEAYEKRDTEVTPWTEETDTPNQDNAALLYYQAFLLRPFLDKTASQKIDDILRGAESDREIRTYLGHCLPVIQAAEIASRIPQCTWAIGYRAGPRFDWKDLYSEVTNLQEILMLDARILAADGHYHAALERCLTLRRLARQLSDSNISGIMSFSWSVDTGALRTAKHILGVMPPNADIISWFRGQLALIQGVPMLLEKTLQANFKSYLYHMRTQPDFFLARTRDLLVKLAEDEQGKENARKLTDEQILSLFGEGHLRFFNSVFRIADSEMTYEQKCTQMQRLVDELEEGDSTDKLVKRFMSLSGTDPLAKGKYPFQVGHVAHINGIKVALEVYLNVAKTGQLPKTIPGGLPKDPFTGLDFVYEITNEGFALRCKGENFQGRRGKRVLEFKVKK